MHKYMYTYMYCARQTVDFSITHGFVALYYETKGLKLKPSYLLGVAISGHFFALCVFIFYKTEVQTVILRCLTGLNSDWFKSYDT